MPTVSKPMACSNGLRQSRAHVCLDNAFRFIDGMTAGVGVWERCKMQVPRLRSVRALGSLHSFRVAGMTEGFRLCLKMSEFVND
jgi:hypothetical protein